MDLLLPRSKLNETYPLMESAQYTEYVLGPGEMLFIPRWWWHFIVAVDRTSALIWRNKRLNVGKSGRGDTCRQDGRSTAVDYSFSVSFWWGKRILKG